MAIAGVTVMAQASSAHERGYLPMPVNSHSQPGIMRAVWNLRSGMFEHFTTVHAETIQQGLAPRRPNPLRIATSSSCRAAKSQAPDSAVSRAVALLGDDAPTERIVVEHTVRLPFVSSVATAWTDGVTIFINDQSEPYERACKDAIALAGAIAHESYHLRHGPDEASAYAEQLRVMRRLGASRHDLDVVERGLHAVQLANQPPTRGKK